MIMMATESPSTKLEAVLQRRAEMYLADAARITITYADETSATGYIARGKGGVMVWITRKGAKAGKALRLDTIRTIYAGKVDPHSWRADGAELWAWMPPNVVNAETTMRGLEHEPNAQGWKKRGDLWRATCSTCRKEAEVTKEGAISGDAIDDPCYPKDLESAIERIEALEDKLCEAEGEVEHLEEERDTRDKREGPTAEEIMEIVDSCEACRDQPEHEMYRCERCRRLMEIASALL